MEVPQFAYSFTSCGHMGHIHLLAIINYAAMCISVCAGICFAFLGYLRVELLDHMVIL